MRFHLALGASVSGTELLKKYRTAEAVYRNLQAVADAGELDENGVRALQLSSAARAAEILAVCREFNWQILTPENPAYPASLLALRDYPAVLFAAGDLRLLRRPLKAAVVGTRAAADAAMGLAYGLGAAFSANGVVTVSGCAKGIDSAAAEGALAYGGSTVGVLGNGFGYNYLPEQVFFRRRILRQGLLLTELPPFTGPTRYSFPRRNRLIAGLSCAVVVAESGRKGGSLITAQDARRQGKPVFVPAASLVDSAGCRYLAQNGAEEFEDAAPLFRLFQSVAPEETFRYPPLKPFTEDPPRVLFPARMTEEEFALAQGVTPAEAHPVFAALSGTAEKTVSAPPVRLPEQMSFDLRKKEKQSRAAAPPPEKAPPAAPAAGKLSGDRKAVYDALGNGAMTLDDLCADTGLEIRTVLRETTLMELEGLLQTLPGNLVGRA